uniref:beta-glucosidase n=1 Tax=Spongospora subterranea TaxID=70186 RepID=A0A0H5R9R2_9EUKA|eukprot:CRZ10422.1 hypothetical protein [Spongospora subterranea]
MKAPCLQTWCPLFFLLCAVTAYNQETEWAAIDDDIRNMVDSMSLVHRIGQMVQLDITMFLTEAGALNQSALHSAVEYFGVGSILNSPSAMTTEGVLSVQSWRQLITDIQSVALGAGPKIPILYGLDGIHGANYVKSTTLFPHQIGLAATFNRNLVRKAFAISAKDTRTCGIPWSFAPVLDICLQKQWPRVYETFGEDPYLASEMGKEAVLGMQGVEKGELKLSTKVASSLKHFVGYSNPRSGQDRTQAWIPDRILRQYFLPPFRSAIKAGAATVMEAYADNNGQPVVSSEFYLKTVLRDELGFKGVLVTDYSEINNLYWWHHAAHSPSDAIRMAIQQTTIDMSMVVSSFNFSTTLTQLVKDGTIDSNRVSISCARVLQLKKNLGLFDDPFPTNDANQINSVGSKRDRHVALDVAQHSITLLKNSPLCPTCRSILPLSRTSSKRMLLVGPSSDSLKLLSSGWTMHWQGASETEFSFGTTIKEGIRRVLHGSSHLLQHSSACSIENCSTEKRSEIIKASDGADIIIVCLSEPVYTEKPGNIKDMEFDQDQIDLVKELHSKGKPIIVILTMGRPRLLGNIVKMASAVIHAYLPGPEGGEAIANIIFGLVNPSGKLPMTWPKHSALLNLPYWHAFSSADTFDVEFQFGDGLSYSIFSYSDLILSNNVMTSSTGIDISVLVSNTGDVDGYETVLLFLTADYRTVSPEVRLLKRFSKVWIPAKTSKLVQFTLFANDTEFFIGDQSIPVLEDGVFSVQVANISSKFNLVGLSPQSRLASLSYNDDVGFSQEILWFIFGSTVFCPVWYYWFKLYLERKHRVGDYVAI